MPGSTPETHTVSLTVSAKSGKGRASMDCTSSVAMSSLGGKDGADMAVRMAGGRLREAVPPTTASPTSSASRD